MNRPSLAAGPLLAVIAGFGIAACGGSSTSTPTPIPTPTPTTAAIGNAGGSLCEQAVADAAQLRSLSTGLSGSPGAVPTLDSFKHQISAVTQVIDSLDSAAPSEI